QRWNRAPKCSACSTCSAQPQCRPTAPRRVASGFNHLRTQHGHMLRVRRVSTHERPEGSLSSCWFESLVEPLTVPRRALPLGSPATPARALASPMMSGGRSKARPSVCSATAAHLPAFGSGRLGHQHHVDAETALLPTYDPGRRTAMSPLASTGY